MSENKCKLFGTFLHLREDSPLVDAGQPALSAYGDADVQTSGDTSEHFAGHLIARDFDNQFPAMDLPGGNNMPNVPRDIGADEYAGLMRRVEFGVQGGAYTVVSAVPTSVLDDPANVTLGVTANPTIKLVVGQRYRFVVNDATNDPIALVAAGTQQGQTDKVLFVMDTRRAVDVNGETEIETDIVQGDIETDPNYADVRWVEEGYFFPGGVEPPPGSAVGGRVSFVFTESVRQILVQENRSLEYHRSVPPNTEERGAINDVPESPASEDTGFPYWWENF